MSDSHVTNRCCRLFFCGVVCYRQQNGKYMIHPDLLHFNQTYLLYHDILPLAPLGNDNKTMIKSVAPRNWILALFIRDDGQRFVLGTGGYEFTDSQLHFQGDDIQNDVVELQGSDGVLLAGQVKRAKTQTFEGYIGDYSIAKSHTEELREAFFGFFQIHHTFTVVYIFSDGTAIKRQRGFISEAPEVQDINQMSPEYSVGLDFEDVNYYEYNENAEGQEIYSNTVNIIKSSEVAGGAMWDQKGLMFDSAGLVWSDGSGGQIVITIRGIAAVYPTVVIPGPTVNPIIENPRTGNIMKWNGTIGAGQELIIDSNTQTVTISGLSQIANFEGDWLQLAEGENRIIFTTDGGSNSIAKISWSEIVG